MTSEIKQRIEQIRNGKIPEGYKKTKTGVIPTSWKYEKLDSYLIQHHEVSTQNNQYPVLTSSRKGIFFQNQYYDKKVASEDNTGYNVVPRGYFTYRHMSDDEVFVFNINSICDKGIVSTLYPVFTVTNSINPYFLQEMLNNGSDFHRYARIQKQGGSRTYMYFNKLTKLSIPISPLYEQNKIMEILSAQDKVIECCEKKIEQLKRMKKYYLQNMFPKRGETVPKIRFKGFTDAWEQRKLGEISKRVFGNDGRMELPTLTISAANGWMNQVDRFSENKAGQEQTNYTLLHKGELSYNHGNSKIAKYGTVFSLESYEEALVPRVYHSFRMIEKHSASFIEYCFATKNLDRELSKLITSGARMDGLLNISFDEFMGINLLLSCTEEQERIANFLRAFDHLIAINQRKLEEEKKKKKALQQLLLTGIVRL